MRSDIIDTADMGRRWNLGRMTARLMEYFIQWKRRWKMKGGRREINVTIRQYCF